ncbi:unnamed protein product [Cyprideis torosa]|uniref:Aldehyde dehydrogenase domain-containing protein n=1 Tax=Cyprideis torosa TaxID=163714 RepID=A0A7R8WCK2_9CRUS|nr:unnamed protein product [Cyprideis torosa]CAG0888073.1 unnamed protein product [Cyprideis torosa]
MQIGAKAPTGGCHIVPSSMPVSATNVFPAPLGRREDGAGETKNQKKRQASALAARCQRLSGQMEHGISNIATNLLDPLFAEAKFTQICNKCAEAKQTYRKHATRKHVRRKFALTACATWVVLPGCNNIALDSRGVYEPTRSTNPPLWVTNTTVNRAVATLGHVVQRLRETFASGKTKDVDFRIQQLQNLQRMYKENKEQFIDVLYKDLRKPRYEAIFTDIDYCSNDIDYLLFNIREWAKDEYVPRNLLTLMDVPMIHNDPFGVVLVIGAWNYPIHLSMLPAAGAIAAGNCVIVKPSELAPNTSKLLAELVPKYLDESCYAVLEGGPKEAQELLKCKLDYIFYTGGHVVGKIVGEAASKNLTPVTLELGGKSPVYVDTDVDVDLAIRRIMWGKCANLGQTCIAPDYVLTTKEMAEKFVTHSQQILKEWYGDDLKSSPDLSRIVNARHFERVQRLLNTTKGEIAVGGKVDASENWIEPTIILNPPLEDPVMQEEIFGPLLPIVYVQNHREAIDIINKGEKPLSMYVFSRNQSIVDDFVNQTSAGGMCINDVVFQLGVDELPFGGVGQSGMGLYHGKYTFETFTHKKSILVRSFNAIGEKLASIRYPPYKPATESYGAMITKKRNIQFGGPWPWWFFFATGMITLGVVQYALKVMGW